MKIFKRLFLGILILVLFIWAGLWISGNIHLMNAVKLTYIKGQDGPGIEDLDYFEHQMIKAGPPQKWAEKLGVPAPDSSSIKPLKDFKTVAFLVIDNDSIVFERYWEGFGSGKTSNSFSMAKSVVSLLIGIAIDDGYIESIDQPVSDFLDGFSEGKAADLRIRHLLQMTSGINFDETYNDAFGFMSKAYYGSDLKKLTFSYQVTVEPGTQFQYLGGNTLLLSFILEKATGKKISDYLSSKVWAPIGAEGDAYWSTDAKGQEKAYCCIYAEARDFARIGKLYLNKGKWNGEQVVSENYLTESMLPSMVNDLNGNPVDYYGFQWWIGIYEGETFYYMRGIGGQYVYVVPEKDLVVVRLGHERSNESRNNVPLDVYEHLKIAFSLDQ